MLFPAHHREKVAYLRTYSSSAAAALDPITVRISWNEQITMILRPQHLRVVTPIVVMAVTRVTIYTCDCLNLAVMSGPHLKLIHVPVARVYNALWPCHFFIPSSPGLWVSGGEANVFVYGYGNRGRAKNTCTRTHTKTVR